MATVLPKNVTTLIIKRTFDASRERVFEAWTKPELLKEWFAPAETHHVPIATIDYRVGGTYRFGIQSKENGKLSVAKGLYREIRPPEKLVFTWTWEGQESLDTLVTIEFRELGKATEVMLKHESFPDPETRNTHSAGWDGCLDRLAKIMQS